MPPQYPTQPNPYEFILNPPPPPKRGLFGLHVGSFAGKILLIVGGAVVLMIILGVIATTIGNKHTSNGDLISLAQTQQELIRVSTAGALGATQQTTKNLAITAEFTLKTQQTQTLSLLAKNGVKKVGDKQLALKQNATTDQQLKAAKQTSTFDLVYSQIAQTTLTDYANTVQQLYNKSPRDDEKNLFSNFYTQTQLLISQIPYTQKDIQAASQ